MYNSKVTCCWQRFRTQLWDEDNPTKALRGVVIEKAALTGMPVPGAMKGTNS